MGLLTAAIGQLLATLPDNVAKPNALEMRKLFGFYQGGNKGRDRTKTKKGASHRGRIYGFRDNGSPMFLAENPAGTKLAKKARKGRCGL